MPGEGNLFSSSFKPRSTPLDLGTSRGGALDLAPKRSYQANSNANATPLDLNATKASSSPLGEYTGRYPDGRYESTVRLQRQGYEQDFALPELQRKQYNAPRQLEFSEPTAKLKLGLNLPLEGAKQGIPSAVEIIGNNIARSGNPLNISPGNPLGHTPEQQQLFKGLNKQNQETLDNLQNFFDALRGKPLSRPIKPASFDPSNWTEPKPKRFDSNDSMDYPIPIPEGLASGFFSVVASATFDIYLSNGTLENRTIPEPQPPYGATPGTPISLKIEPVPDTYYGIRLMVTYKKPTGQIVTEQAYAVGLANNHRNPSIKPRVILYPNDVPSEIPLGDPAQPKFNPDDAFNDERQYLENGGTGENPDFNQSNNPNDDLQQKIQDLGQKLDDFKNNLGNPDPNTDNPLDFDPIQSPDPTDKRIPDVTPKQTAEPQSKLNNPTDSELEGVPNNKKQEVAETKIQTKTEPKPQAQSTPKRCEDPCVQGLHDKMDDKKPDEDKIAIASVPEWWQARRGADIPQLAILFAEEFSTGKLGKSRWTLCIPHYNRPKGAKPAIPSYNKGNWFGTLKLTDGSKLGVNASSSSECKRVLNRLKIHIPVEYRTVKGKAIKPRIVEDPTANLKECRVTPVRADYYSTGQANLTPDWSIKLRDK